MTKYLLLLLLLVAIGCVACTQAPVQQLAQPSVQPLAQTLPKPAHVVIVILENKSYENIIDSENAPYINQLAKMGASLNLYAFHHPSQPNYFELFAGTHTLAITQVVPVTINDVASLPQPYSVIDDTCTPGLSITPSLGGLLGKNFLGYGEDWDPANPFECLNERTYYARKHLPWTGFLDSIAASRTFTDFKTLSQTQSFEKLPLVSIVIPNLVHDMHSLPGSTVEGNNIPKLVQNGDTWLQENLDGYVQWAMKNNSLLIVTWDENSLNKEERHDNGKGFEPPKNHIPTILVGQMVKPGSTSPGSYNHYDLLRTIEDMYLLSPPYLGGSRTARDITDIWQ